VLSNILVSRLTQNVEKITGDYQCGFGHNRSTTDQIFCVHHIRENNGTVHDLFIDSEKACDSVRREVLYNIVTEYGVT
jgi:hypothetical protein